MLAPSGAVQGSLPAPEALQRLLSGTGLHAQHPESLPGNTAVRHGISLRNVDTLLRQALDHCAAQTGQTVIGGIGTVRQPSTACAGRRHPCPAADA